VPKVEMNLRRVYFIIILLIIYKIIKIYPVRTNF
jgi:hypothetical protein